MLLVAWPVLLEVSSQAALPRARLPRALLGTQRTRLLVQLAA